VTQFLATVEDYERLERSMPLGDKIDALGHGDDEERRWRFVMHSLVLRKYYARGDQLSLVRVARSLRLCEPGREHTEEQWEELIDNADKLRAGIQYVVTDLPSRNEFEVLMDGMYGRYLHGDYEKWTRATALSDGATDGALFFAVVARADRVRMFTRWITLGIQEGAVILD
jgi:hypothetical protein